MLIVCQKFRLRMLGHDMVMPRHHAQHVQNVGPSLFARNENIAHIMPCGTARAMTSCAHCMACACRKPATLYICGMPRITYGHAICAS